MDATDFNATAIATIQQAVAAETDQVRRSVQDALSALGPWPESGDLLPANAYAIWVRTWSAEIAQALTLLGDVSTLLTHLSSFLVDLDGSAQSAFGG